MTDQEKSESEALFNLTEIGSEIAGGLAPIAVGAVVAGPVGVFAGAVAAPFAGRAFGRLAKEFNERVLGRREKIRVGAVILYAAKKINQKIEAGHQPRQDDFFQPHPGDRATAEEIAEGVLLVAQREHEERKIKYYGNLLASFVFHSEIDRSTANALIQQVESMTYRQLCLLSLFAQRDTFPGLMQQLWYNHDREREAIASSLFTDLYNLSQQGIFNFKVYNDEVHVPLHPLALGRLLFDLMELTGIERPELEPLAAMLPEEDQLYY